MERDKKLEKIVRENSLMAPSDNFTESVLNKIRVMPIESSFKPLIGKRAGFIAITLVATILLVGIFSSLNGGSEPLFNIPEWSIAWPEWNITLPEFSWKLPAGLLAGVVAVFILVLTDAGLSRNRS